MVPCALHASQGGATVLRTVTDSLARKELDRTRILMSLDRDVEVEQAAYFKDFFGVRSLGTISRKKILNLISVAVPTKEPRFAENLQTTFGPVVLSYLTGNI